MQQIDNFLSHYAVSQARLSIKGIDESYNNEWDIIAELIQNAVDAIRESSKTDGKIFIEIDCQNYTIRVQDNGVGINPDKFTELISLFGSNKRDDEKTIGEKGVGLKFAMFSCNDFHIKTGYDGSKITEAWVKDASNWKGGSGNDFLVLNYDTSDGNFRGTDVFLKAVPETHPVFQLNLNQLRYVLRTRTAIGNSNKIWADNQPDITVTLSYVAPDGNKTVEIIPYEYWLPIEGLADTEIISMDEWKEFNKQIRTDPEKTKKLREKILYDNSTHIDIGNRKIKVFSCVVPGRKTWKTLSKTFNLATEEQLEDDDFKEKNYYAIFQPGIFTSVKGMPTGITIETPNTGTSGLWPQLFILFEDSKLKFDIGRKTVHGKLKYKEYAKKIFYVYRDLAMYISGDVSTENTVWDRDTIFTQIESLIDLNNPKTKFLKSPRDQEGSVVAIFFEALGNGTISGLKPLTFGYKKRYDFYAKWGSKFDKKAIIEFKTKLSSIISDFGNETKMFNEIDCIVCWEITEDDIQKLKNQNITLEKKPPVGILGKQNPEDFPHYTHVLRTHIFNKPIYVIDMKVVLEP